MATAIIEASVDKQRNIIILENLPGRTTPLYLGSQYKGDTVTLAGYVTGTSYADAKSQIATLESTFLGSESMTLAGYTGYVESFTYTDRPGKKSQRIALRLRRLT